MANLANSFASKFDSDFRLRTHGLTHNEIPLFQALHHTLVGLSNKFEIEEYHGTSHQVSFSCNRSYAREYPRCELSDLMIITFSSITRNARLTYIQAKSERAILQSVQGHQFSANLEQWFLLSLRPIITGIGAFDPPQDLLSNALLPSVGSFAFFYKDGASQFQTFYAAANTLFPPKPYSQRYGKLQAQSQNRVINNGGFTECIAACGNYSFAESLYRLEIGTPVHSSIAQALPTRNWLASILGFQIENASENNKRSELAQELLKILAPEESWYIPGSFGAKELIIIKSQEEFGTNR